MMREMSRCLKNGVVLSGGIAIVITTLKFAEAP